MKRALHIFCLPETMQHGAGILDPTPFNAADIRQIVSLLRSRPLSETLDDLFTRKEYPANILSRLRREDFRSMSYKQTGLFFKQTIDQFYDELVRTTILKSFKLMLVNNNITLAMRCYLICRPMLVRAFERICLLPETGNLSQCIQNYRDRYYTILQQDPKNYLYEAIGCGHQEMVLIMLEKYPFNEEEDEPLDYLIYALKKGRRQIAEILIKHIPGLDPNQLLVSAVATGAFWLVDRLLAAGVSYHNDLAGSAGFSGNVDMIKKIFALNTVSDESFLDCLKSVLYYGHVTALNYLRSVRPDLVERYFQNLTDLRVRRCWQMIKVLLSENYSFEISPILSLLDEPDLADIIRLYGGRLVSSGRQILIKSIINYNYDIFDAVLPFVAKNNHSGLDRVIEKAIKYNSRYFFDRLMLHFTQASASMSSMMLASCRRDVQDYFFEFLWLRYSQMVTPQGLNTLLCQSIRVKRSDIFHEVLPQASQHAKKLACCEAYRLGYFKYFEQLFVIELQTPEFVFEMVGYPKALVPIKANGKILSAILKVIGRTPDTRTDYVYSFIDMIATKCDLDFTRICVQAVMGYSVSAIMGVLDSILSYTPPESGARNVPNLILSTGLITADILAEVFIRSYTRRIPDSDQLAANVRYILENLSHLKCVAELTPRLKVEYEMEKIKSLEIS